MHIKPDPKYSVAPIAVGLAFAVLCSASCQTDLRGNSWQFDETPTSSEPDGEATSGGEEETPEPGVPPRPDAGSSIDVVSIDTGLDTGPLSDDAESGGTPVEATGLLRYVGGEPPGRALFYRNYRPDDGPETTPAGGTCNNTVQNAEFDEKWLAVGVSKSKLLRVPQPSARRDAFVAAATVTGTLRRTVDTADAEHPRLTVQTLEIHSCATFDAVGGCLEPRTGDRCFRDDEPPESHLELLSVENVFRAGRASRTYHVTFDFGWERIADGGHLIEATIEAPAAPEDGIRRWSLDGRVRAMTARYRTFAGNFECTYDAEAVDGWARRIGDYQSLEVHITAPDASGENDGCEAMSSTIWGEIDIDDVQYPE